LRFVSREKAEALPPPTLTRGPIAWARENLFSSVFNTILTALSLIALYFIIPPLVKFLFINAAWTGTDRAACREDMVGHPVGACWAFVWDRLSFFTYGSYPPSEPSRCSRSGSGGSCGSGLRDGTSARSISSLSSR
jgi:general L-amino acid transport system permease protein